MGLLRKRFSSFLLLFPRWSFFFFCAIPGQKSCSYGIPMLMALNNNEACDLLSCSATSNTSKRPHCEISVPGAHAGCGLSGWGWF